MRPSLASHHESDSWIGTIVNSTNWRWRRIHGHWIVVGFLLLALVEIMFRYSWKFPALTLNAGFFTIGMLHGATDPWQLFQAGKRDGKWHLLVFYVALLIVSLTSLVIFPAFAITAFLILAGIHFGIEDLPDPRLVVNIPLTIAARGLLVVGLPLAIHGEESIAFLELCHSVLSIEGLSFLGVQSLPADVTGQTFTAIVFVTVALHAGLACQRENGTRQWWLEVMVLTGCVVLMHPLFFIGLYLLGWHAVKSTIQCVKDTEASERRVTFAATLLATIPIWTVVLFLCYRSNTNRSLEFSSLFVGSSSDRLAAFAFLSYAVVTLPHLWWHACSPDVVETSHRTHGKSIR